MTYGSVNAAARFLNTSQPALSVALKQMEDSLGYNLFDRQRGRLIPTENAKLLHDQSRKVIDEVDVFSRLANNLARQTAEDVSIGCVPALSFDILPGALARFRQYHPTARVSVRTTHKRDATQFITRKDINIAFLFFRDNSPDVFDEIGQAELLRVTRKGKETAEQNFINIQESGPVGEIVQRYFQDNRVKTDWPLSVESYHTALSMVEKGHGYTIIDGFTAAALNNNGLSFRRIQNLEPVKVGVLMREEERASRILQSLVRCVREEIGHCQGVMV